MKEIGDNAGNNLKPGFEVCGIVLFNPQNVLKRIPQRTTSSDVMSFVYVEDVSFWLFCHIVQMIIIQESIIDKPFLS